MRRFMLALFAMFMTIILPMPDAEAKRMGGGRSSGMQRDALPQKPASTPAPQRESANAAPANSGAAAAPGKRSWMGPVAGLAAGLGLAALASHLGMGEEFANFLLIALLVVAAIFLFRFFTRRAAPAPQTMQYAGLGGHGGVTPVSGLGGAPVMSSTETPATNTLPAGFDAEAFTRQAKLNFIRLQAASDAGNLDDIREFATPEMYAEIKLQLDERGDVETHTEVVQLDAEVLECVEEPNRYLVSVRFHGLIREDEATGTAVFDEVWHLVKPASGKGGWQIAGIQQLG
jgi:predicted lipid-binding transport protein (Tim44 family)